MNLRTFGQFKPVSYSVCSLYDGISNTVPNLHRPIQREKTVVSRRAARIESATVCGNLEQSQQFVICRIISY